MRLNRVCLLLSTPFLVAFAAPPQLQADELKLDAVAESGAHAFVEMGEKGDVLELVGRAGFRVEVRRGANHLEISDAGDVAYVGAWNYPQGKALLWSSLGSKAELLETDGPHIARFAPSTGILAVQRLESLRRPLAPVGDIRVFRVSSRVPAATIRGVESLGLHAEPSDLFEVSRDGQALVVFRAKERVLEVVPLFGESTSSSTVDLGNLMPGYLPEWMVPVSASQIVLSTGELSEDSLRVLRLGEEAQWHSIQHAAGYWTLRDVAGNGRLLVSGADGFDVLDLEGELLWRIHREGPTELTRQLPTLDINRYRPSLTSRGDILLEQWSLGSEKLIVRLSRDDDAASLGEVANGASVTRVSDEIGRLALLEFARLAEGTLVDRSGSVGLEARARGSFQIPYERP